MIWDLKELRIEADQWLLVQPCDRALDPFAIAYFRQRFCLPQFFVDAIRHAEEKEARGDIA